MTPIEMQNYEFATQKFGGYNKKQVDEFMEITLKEFEKYYRENLELKDRITVLNESVKNFKAMEDSLQNTLVFAQNTAEDIKKNAQQKADVILEEARASASAVLADLDKQKLETERKLEEVQNQYTIFKSKYQSVLEAELRILEDLGK